ncbi:MAG: chemotaxis response regulator protein-glutamate methylesterase [Phycisphaerae bacterium]
MQRIGPIKVLIVDDSALVRTMLTHALTRDPGIRVVAGAGDPFEARECIITHRPDVIILDMEMPRMDGLTFLRKLMAHYPVPVIVCSTITPANSRLAVEAMEAGAFDVVLKPSGSKALQKIGEDLIEKIQAASQSMPPPPPIPASAGPVSFRAAGLDPAKYLIAVGASTGGTEAIRLLLSRMGPDFPPVVMVQHMPEGFTQSFARRLDQITPPAVAEAVDSTPARPGNVLLGRGGVQMRVRLEASGWRIRYGTSELVNRHCPSVDVLFDSVAQTAGRQAVGVILTGMGDDGARGLLKMHQAGAWTVGQDPRSCVVYGMPKVAHDLGAVDCQANPADMARLIVQALKTRESSRALATRT